MKLSVFLLALAPPGATGGRAGAAQHHIAVAAEVENGPGVHPDAARDIAACTRVASRFIKTPATRVVVMEHVKNFCATSKRLAKSNFACPHFQEAVEAALSQQPEDTKFNPRSFCEATEGHMLNMRGATRVPHTGSGPLQDFKISQQCEHIVSAAVKPQVNVPTNKVPDLWYALCMNQNCAHFLPSRTKWCDEKVTPTHGVQVCEAVRKFALDEVAVHETGEMDAQQMCTLFGEFVRETGIDVDAYEHVIHEPARQRADAPACGRDTPASLSQ